MKTVKKVAGWLILTVGALGTASNVASLVIGVPGRAGYLLFGAALVLLGLWMARPTKRAAGWLMLIVGGSATEFNVPEVVIGVPGRAGYLLFGVALVLLGLWMARPTKRAAGWLILIVGGLAAASYVAALVIGVPMTAGHLLFGVALVLLGLWMARPFARPTKPAKEAHYE